MNFYLIVFREFQESLKSLPPPDSGEPKLLENSQEDVLIMNSLSETVQGSLESFLIRLRPVNEPRVQLSSR